MPDWKEEDRLGELRRLNILDSPREESFDEIVQAAAHALHMPLAAISLIDADRQWFKATVGLEISETSRDISFCTHTIEEEGVMVVPDATRDARFAENPLVADDPSLRFYAGAVIRGEAGLPLGTLCVIDTAVHPEGLDAEQRELLQTLADLASDQLRLRSLVADYAARAAQATSVIEATRNREDRLERALGSGSVGWWEWEIKDDLVYGSADLARDFALDPAVARNGAPIAVFFANVHPLDRTYLIAAVDEAVETGQPFREEYRILHPGGKVVWILARGRCFRDAQGKPDRFPGIVMDVTQRKETERRLRESDLGRELAMSAAHLGAWDHDLLRGTRRYDKRCLQLLGITEGESADIGSTYGIMHPDDRARVAQAQRMAVSPDRTGPFREVFRVIDRATGETRWISAVGRSEFHDGICTRFIGVMGDVTEERTADEHRRMLADEMNHRVKNMLAVVGSIVDASIRGAEDMPTARRTVSERLASFGKAHDVLTAESWVSADIGMLIRGACDGLGIAPVRLDIAGPPTRLSPKQALQLSLALHELGTNAIKYGALSNDIGRIRIAWEVPLTDPDHFLLGWAERGGPPVAPPTRKGFGTRLIEVATAAEFRGTSKLDYRPSGLCWTLTVSLEQLTAELVAPR